MKLMSFPLYAFLVTVLLGLSGCQTQNPYTGEQQTQKSAKYGMIAGAACGVGAALLSGNNRARNAAIGAAACGGAGAAYGYYVDKQEAALRQRLQGTGVQVKRQGDNLYLIMPGDITFATDSYQIDSHFYPVLNSVATVLKKFDESNISVEGYTDSTGSFEYNQVLSEKRANSVASYLISQGVASDRIAAFGRGERNPVASNKTASGRASNRRVEISIKPRG